MKNVLKRVAQAAGIITILAVVPAVGAGPVQVPAGGIEEGFQLSPELVFPAFDAALGRKLFATKGCVVCHEANGIGGTDGPSMSYGKYDTPVNAMEVASDLWEKAPIMIPMQEDELGAQIELSPEELAAIIAFLGSPSEQAKFSKDQIPADILKDMEDM
ncbi:hypothetical protein MNBD_ALPHA12-1812 [hydrothermal vent metagenome]|uniref:Cytochrome c domain-containing protein n=1 Tax=hydrothermal vent metagenome TaxID=652676 RepID=A0A3B0TKV1_9ZZZZ